MEIMHPFERNNREKEKNSMNNEEEDGFKAMKTHLDNLQITKHKTSNKYNMQQGDRNQYLIR